MGLELDPRRVDGAGSGRGRSETKAGAGRPVNMITRVTEKGEQGSATSKPWAMGGSLTQGSRGGGESERAGNTLRPERGESRALCTPRMRGGGSGPSSSTVTWGHLASPGGQKALSDC